MRQNEFVAVSTDKALLVPYDRRHVLTYHGWMEDPAIQEATASERLTLEEEYENQESWRASHDKMTFIVCQPLPQSNSGRKLEFKAGKETIQAGTVDAPEKMVGDINLFLSPYEEDDEAGGTTKIDNGITQFVGEVDIMIANVENQGRGIGKAAVVAFLGYIGRHLGEILREYYYQGQQQPQHGQESEPDSSSFSNLKQPKMTSESSPVETGTNGNGRPNHTQFPAEGPEKKENVKLGLHSFIAKINQTNERSIALFKSLGFEQEGDGPNFFGEVKLVLSFAEFTKRFSSYSISNAPAGYEELIYDRTGTGEDGQ